MSQEIPALLKLKVVTSKKLLVDTETPSVSLPSLDGYIGILPGHRPLVAALGDGEISYMLKQKEIKLEISGGYAEIHPDRVLVFTDRVSKDVDRSDAG